MFAGFEQRRIGGRGADINLRIGGAGPPLLLLHGYPQTHVMWHRVAPALAERFTVICADLRGYGDSDKPPGDATHGTYSKRAMADDQWEVMSKLGFARFRVAGHDRGARVAHRLALDHPECVIALAALDIVPTSHVFASMNQRLALAYYHWLFLAQPDGLPEHLIGGDPDYYLQAALTRWSGGGNPFDAQARHEYLRCFREPSCIHATCEDYRAGAGIDLEHHAADRDRRIECPLLVLWGQDGIMGDLWDVLTVWREYATDVRGSSLECGHFLAEEAPDETLEHLLRFFATVNQ